MKKLTFMLLFLFLSFFSFAVCCAEELVFEDFTYTVLNDGSVEILRYIGTDPTVTVPESIEKAPVTSIGNSAFSYNDTLENVILPDSIVSIGNFTFGECTALKSVTLPEGLLSLGNFAFQGCISIESLPLPATLVSIGWNPFDRCDALEAIEFNGENLFYLAEEGVLFDRNNNILISYPRGKQDETYEIPEWVTEVGMAGFSECPWVKEISIPEELTVLNGNPFCGCTALEKINIAMMNQVFEVHAGSLFNSQTRELIAYLRSSDSDSYNIPTGTISITREAFYKHGELKTIRIPDSVTIINDAAFAESGLTSITIPESVIWLGNQTFSNCTDLKSVKLPESLTRIGDSVFYACDSLESINLPKSLISIGDAAFMNCTKLESITLPKSIRIIGNYAFALCTGLTDVDFPDRLYSIGGGAFYGDTELMATVPGGSLAEEWAIRNEVEYILKDVDYLPADAA